MGSGAGGRRQWGRGWGIRVGAGLGRAPWRGRRSVRGCKGGVRTRRPSRPMCSYRARSSGAASATASTRRSWQPSHRRWCDYSSKPPRITTGLWRTLSQNSRPSRRGWISAALRPPSSCATTAKSLGRGWPSLSGGMSVDERTHVCAFVCTRTHYMHTLPLDTLPLR